MIKYIYICSLLIKNNKRIINIGNKNRIRIKKIFLILLCINLCSCCITRYEYRSNEKKIISNGRNNISRISIETKDGKQLAYYSAILDKPSKVFSLENFSPNNFECISGCNFTFIPDSIYQIRILPSGDRISLPFKVIVKSNRTIEEIK